MTSFANIFSGWHEVSFRGQLRDDLVWYKGRYPIRTLSKRNKIHLKQQIKQRLMREHGYRFDHRGKPIVRYRLHTEWDTDIRCLVWL